MLFFRKKIFKDFRYEKLNILSDNLSQKFNSIICFSMLYLFEKKELEMFFKKTNNALEPNGLLIVDPGGAENNFFSFIKFNNSFLLIKYPIQY